MALAARAGEFMGISGLTRIPCHLGFRQLLLTLKRAIVTVRNEERSVRSDKREPKGNSTG